MEKITLDKTTGVVIAVVLGIVVLLVVVLPLALLLPSGESGSKTTVNLVLVKGMKFTLNKQFKLFQSGVASLWRNS